MADEFPPASFEEVPIIFISTHGVYDLNKEPEPFTVPANIHVFETETIGDVCLTTIDKPLWNLINNRGAFLKYLAGKGDLATATEIAASAVYGPDDEDDENDAKPSAKHYAYKKVFRNLHYYRPGDTIYNRTLIIGGGGEGARRSYANMGFYRFDVGAPIDSYPDGSDSKIRELQPLRTEMIEDEDLKSSQREMIDEVLGVQEDVADGAIFIFSSCGAFWKEEAGKKVSAAKLNKRIATIEAHQRAQDLALMELTPAGPGGAGANNNIEEEGSLPEGRNIHPREAKGSAAAFVPSGEGAAEAGDEFFGNNNADFQGRDPRFAAVEEAEAAGAFEEVDEAAAEREEKRAAAAGKKAVFIQTESGGYAQIPTVLTAESSSPDLLFTARNIRDAKKAYGEVYGFSRKAQAFHLLGGGRRRTVRRGRGHCHGRTHRSGSRIPGHRRGRQTHRR
jgi:hypothetical protein